VGAREFRRARFLFAGDAANAIDGVRRDVPKPRAYRFFVVPESEHRQTRMRGFLREAEQAGSSLRSRTTSATSRPPGFPSSATDPAVAGPLYAPRRASSCTAISAQRSGVRGKRRKTSHAATIRNVVGTAKSSLMPSNVASLCTAWGR